MKTNIISILILVATLQSCKENKIEEKQESQVQSEKVVPNECYTAIYEKDTLRLALNTAQSPKVAGNMMMKISGQPVKDGKIAGEFRGDTLFVDYTFTEDKNEVTFKNPLALLKKGNQYILGNGEIETYLGKTYFTKGKPIDFEKVKYKFSSADCEEIK